MKSLRLRKELKDMAAKLFVGNLEYTVTSEELRNHFLSVGNIIDCVVISDKFSGRSRGFGFVEFETDEQANEAVEKLNGSDLKGRNITVSIARPQEPRDGSGGNSNASSPEPAPSQEEN